MVNCAHFILDFSTCNAHNLPFGIVGRARNEDEESDGRDLYRMCSLTIECVLLLEESDGRDLDE